MSYLVYYPFFCFIVYICKCKISCHDRYLFCFHFSNVSVSPCVYLPLFPPTHTWFSLSSSGVSHLSSFVSLILCPVTSCCRFIVLSTPASVMCSSCALCPPEKFCKFLLPQRPFSFFLLKFFVTFWISPAPWVFFLPESSHIFSYYNPHVIHIWY